MGAVTSVGHEGQFQGLIGRQDKVWNCPATEEWTEQPYHNQDAAHEQRTGFKGGRKRTEKDAYPKTPHSSFGLSSSISSGSEGEEMMHLPLSRGVL